MDLGNVAPADRCRVDRLRTASRDSSGASVQCCPSDDPFYDPPQGFQHAAPGTVLRSRDVEVAFLGLIPQKFIATQLLYRTTDMHGEPEATVTTVIAPAERGPERACPVVSYQCAIDAVTSRCFPSYALRRRALAPGALAQFEFFLIAAALAEGWAVSVPDHEGRAGAWGTPYEPGYRVLDGLRAALSTESARPVGDGADRPVGLLRRRPGHRVGCRDERHLCARAEHRRRGARIARRRPRPHVPPTQRRRLSRACPRWWWPR